MRKANDGVTLASIVAKETTDGQWSGGGAGVGIALGSLALFGARMRGTKREQTKRAQEFKAPPKPSFNNLWVYGPVLLLLGAGLAYAVAGPFMMGFFEAMGPSSAPSGSATARMDENLGALMKPFFIVLPVMLVVAGLCKYLFGDTAAREAQEARRYKAAKAMAEVDEEIYLRLRYVEADHIVFDPETMEECPATAESIQALIAQIGAKTSILHRKKHQG